MGISIWQLLIVLVIVLLLFGTKRLRTLGGDLGTSIRGFKDAMKKDGSAAEDDGKEEDAKAERVIESDAEKTASADTATATPKEQEKA